MKSWYSIFRRIKLQQYVIKILPKKWTSAYFLFLSEPNAKFSSTFSRITKIFWYNLDGYFLNSSTYSPYTILQFHSCGPSTTRDNSILWWKSVVLSIRQITAMIESRVKLTFRNIGILKKRFCLIWFLFISDIFIIGRQIWGYFFYRFKLSFYL